MRAIKFAADGMRGIAAGDGGTLLATRDGGLSWRALASAPADLRGLSISETGTRIVAVGAGGLVWRSADEGASWSRIATGTSSTLNAIGFFDENPEIGWAVGAAGTVLYTDDGGEHFAALQSPFASDIYSVEDL